MVSSSNHDPKSLRVTDWRESQTSDVLSAWVKGFPPLSIHRRLGAWPLGTKLHQRAKSFTECSSRAFLPWAATPWPVSPCGPAPLPGT